jgi:hypothetical protein
MSIYRNRRVSLATRHAKERAIARPLRVLGLETIVPADLDTDALGTFSGEIPRDGAPRDVCLRKARMGMPATGLQLGMANEGSFGPHPFIPFVPAGHEIMTFVDDDRGLVITESLWAKRTNYNHFEVYGFDELVDWLPKVRFPSHALMVWPKSNRAAVEKGIQSHDELKAAVERAARASSDGIAWVATDMRAHVNPSRMSTIRRLAFRLARRLATSCPQCGAPGWGRTEFVTGLPCEMCGTPTEQIKAEVFMCVACNCRQERPRPDGLVRAAAGHCPYCNP